MTHNMALDSNGVLSLVHSLFDSLFGYYWQKTIIFEEKGSVTILAIYFCEILSHYHIPIVLERC